MSGTQGPDVQAVPEAMTEAAKGIDDALAELKGIAGDDLVSAGYGLSELAEPLGRPTTGDDALSAALAGFLDRWGWGVHVLVQEAGGISAKLAASGAEYQQTENSIVGLMKRAMFDATGDPLGDSGAAAGQSWEQLEAGSAPDRSPDSLGDALDHAATTWSTTAADAWRNSGPGMAIRASRGENPFQGQVDDVAGLHEIVE
jgi:hypothetical protein